MIRSVEIKFLKCSEDDDDDDAESIVGVEKMAINKITFIKRESETKNVQLKSMFECAEDNVIDQLMNAIQFSYWTCAVAHTNTVPFVDLISNDSHWDL